MAGVFPSRVRTVAAGPNQTRAAQIHSDRSRAVAVDPDRPVAVWNHYDPSRANGQDLTAAQVVRAVAAGGAGRRAPLRRPVRDRGHAPVRPVPVVAVPSSRSIPVVMCLARSLARVCRARPAFGPVCIPSRVVAIRARTTRYAALTAPCEPGAAVPSVPRSVRETRARRLRSAAMAVVAGATHGRRRAAGCDRRPAQRVR